MTGFSKVGRSKDIDSFVCCETSTGRSKEISLLSDVVGRESSVVGSIVSVVVSTFISSIASSTGRGASCTGVGRISSETSTMGDLGVMVSLVSIFVTDVVSSDVVSSKLSRETVPSGSFSSIVVIVSSVGTVLSIIVASLGIEVLVVEVIPLAKGSVMFS
jgi:hypothetical protein